MTIPAQDDQQPEADEREEDSAAGAGAAAALIALLIYTLLGVTLLQSAFFGHDVVSPGAFWVQSGPFNPAMSNQVPPGLSLLSDRVTQFLPWMRYAADNFARDGRLPLWKSLASCGAPLVGNGQSAMYFPTNLAAIVLGAPAWISAAQGLVKLAGGAFFAYLLARHLRLSFLAALLAGLVFGFGGFEVLFLQHPHTNVSMLLPLLLLAADRVALRPTRGRVALLAVVAGLQHLGGHAETGVHCQLAAGVLGLARAWSLRREVPPIATLTRRLLALGAGLTLGALLGAIQILPQLEYIAESDALVLRARGLSEAAPQPLWPRLGFVAAVAVAVLCLRHVARGRRLLWLAAAALAGTVYFGLTTGLAGGLSPLYIAPLAADWFGTVHDYFGSLNYVEQNGAFAGAALPLALLGLLAGRPRGVVRAAGVLLGVGLLALYTSPGVNEVLAVLPGLKLAVNTRLSLLALLATGLLAGFGLDALGRAARAGAGFVSRLGLRYVLVVLALAAGSYGALAVSVHRGEITGKTTPDGYPDFTVNALSVQVINERLPKPLVARFTENATAMNEPYKFFAGWFKTPSPVTSALMLYGPSNRAAPVLFTPVLEHGDSGPPEISPDGEPLYLFVSAVPLKAFPAERSTVRLRVGLEDGRTVFSSDIRSPEDPGATDWPFPAQPAPGRAWSQLLLLLLAGLLCAAFTRVRGGTREAARLTLVALVAASLLPFTAGMLPLLPAGAFYPRSGALDRLRHIGPSARMLAMVPGDFSAEIPTWYGIPDVRGYDALHPRRVARLLRQATDEPPYTWPMEILPHRQSPDLRLLGLMAVGYVAGWNDAPAELPVVHYAGESLLPPWSPFRIVSNPEFLPRARLVGGAVIEPDDERALQALIAPELPLATTAVLSRGAPAAAGAGPVGTALIEQDRPEVVRITVDPQRPCHLVLADSYFPGWVARVDGQEREIVRANLAFRAVAVAPGDRVVEFRYRPLWYRVGKWLSALSALAVLALCLPLRRASPARAVAAAA